MKTIPAFVIAASLALLGAMANPAFAQATAPQAKSTAAAAAEMTDGEVRRVDLAQGKVTLKHGDIKNLDMPAMTMVFGVKDKAMLANLKAGDKIKFKAIDDAGKLTVVELVPAK